MGDLINKRLLNDILALKEQYYLVGDTPEEILISLRHQINTGMLEEDDDMEDIIDRYSAYLMTLATSSD